MPTTGPIVVTLPLIEPSLGHQLAISYRDESFMFLWRDAEEPRWIILGEATPEEALYQPSDGPYQAVRLRHGCLAATLSLPGYYAQLAVAREDGRRLVMKFDVDKLVRVGESLLRAASRPMFRGYRSPRECAA